MTCTASIGYNCVKYERIDIGIHCRDIEDDMKRRLKVYKESLVFKISVGTAAIMTILLALLVAGNLYSMKAIKENVVNSGLNELGIHTRDINNSLDNALSDLNSIALSTDDLTSLRSTDSSTRYFAAEKLADVLAKRVSAGKTTDILAIYNADYDILLSRNSNRVPNADKIAVSDYIKTRLIQKKPLVSELWSAIWIKHTVYFIKMYKFNNTIILAMVKADTLLAFTNIRMTDVKDELVLTDTTGHLLSRWGLKHFGDVRYPLASSRRVQDNVENRYMVISVQLETSHAELSMIIKKTNVLKGLGYLQWVILLLSIAAVILMLFVFHYLRKEILQPVKGLVIGTQQVEQGQLEYQVADTGRSLEFKTLTKSFNSMVREIKTLKIAAYEEQIELQRAELRYLQMQIRPHFFLNALTTVHSLTFKDNNEDIRHFIDALSKHLRYMFKGGLNPVTVREEIEYIRNYFYMQELRYPDGVFYAFDVDPAVELESIPQFIIHTFVENSFKHAVKPGEPISIFVKVKQFGAEENAAVKILVEDRGDGFPQEILDSINDPLTAESKDGYKIGISNIKRTLSLLYGREDLLKVSNVEGLGGRVEMIIPIQRRDQIETDHC